VRGEELPFYNDVFFMSPVPYLRPGNAREERGREGEGRLELAT